MKGLVLARAGARSLHPCWVNGGPQRDWDLKLVPYQAVPPHGAVDCTTTDVIPGPKWSGLRQVLHEWDGWREYDMVWMPDDDLYADQDTIGRMFDIAARAGLDLFAPALHETSYYAHFDTMRNPSFYGRRVGFVEIMVPALSRRALETIIPTLDETATGWGWGLDAVWPQLLG